METKAFGIIDFEVKSLTTTEDDEHPHGSFEVVLSAPTLDRDGEIIDAKAFEPLPDHITFDIDHGLSVATTVGSGTPVYEGDLVKVKGTFTSLQRGQDVRTLVKEKHIRTVSAAFIGAQREKDEKGIPHVRKAELINAAFCAVPVNREALVLAAKAIDAKAGARNNSSDAARLQSIHDLAVENGASCSGAKAVALAEDPKPPETKAVVGSYEQRQQALREALVEVNQDALRAAFPNSEPGDYAWRISVVATFDDRVVYRIGWEEDADCWQVGYSWDGQTVTVEGTPEAVKVNEIVSPAGEQAATESADEDASAAKAVDAADVAEEDGETPDEADAELALVLASIDIAVATAA